MLLMLFLWYFYGIFMVNLPYSTEGLAKASMAVVLDQDPWNEVLVAFHGSNIPAKAIPLVVWTRNAWVERVHGELVLLFFISP